MSETPRSSSGASSFNDLITAAEHLAEAAHDDQTDKAGVPSVTHPERVARTAAKAPEHLCEEVQAVAWLHEAVEDTGVTLQGLRQQGFPEIAAAKYQRSRELLALD